MSVLICVVLFFLFPFIYLLYLYCLTERISLRYSSEEQACCVLCFCISKETEVDALPDASSVGGAIMLTDHVKRRERGAMTSFLIKTDCITDNLLYGI